MNNQLAVALGVLGGYALGRTKKAKMALGVGSLVLGKRLKLSPQQIAGVVSRQLSANPQLAGIRDELRDELKGAGKAAAGALVTRRVDSFADALHGRTQGLRERLDTGSVTDKVPGQEQEEAEPEEPEESKKPEEPEESEESEERGSPAAKAAAKKPPTRKAESGKPPTKRASKDAGGRKPAPKEARPRRKPAGRESGHQAARSASRRTPERGGGDHD